PLVVGWVLSIPSNMLEKMGFGTAVLVWHGLFLGVVAAKNAPTIATFSQQIASSVGNTVVSSAPDDDLWMQSYDYSFSFSFEIEDTLIVQKVALPDELSSWMEPSGWLPAV
ncbi:unnamed protein product, partial [Heterosigma akashiwo]